MNSIALAVIYEIGTSNSKLRAHNMVVIGSARKASLGKVLGSLIRCPLGT